MAIVNLSAPWVEHYRKLHEMFRMDHQINVVFDAEEMKINVYVDNVAKAEALTDLLIPEVSFGNVTVPVVVIPSNDPKPNLYRLSFRDSNGDLTPEGKFRAAFSGNCVIEDITTAVGLGGQQMLFVIFRPIVAQYFNDDIGDFYGLCTTVFEDIARDVFAQQPFVYFSTVPRVDTE